MNKSTYLALQRIIEQARYIAEVTESGIKQKDLIQVEEWIDEVSKDYDNMAEQYT